MNLRGSEIGRCHQYLAIKALGLPLEQPPSYLQKIFEAGNRQEDEAIAWLEGELLPLSYVTDRQREVIYNIGEHTVTGHIDGIEIHALADHTGHHPSGGEIAMLLEVKAMSQERFASLWSGKLEDSIADQVAAYCLALLQEGEEIEGFTVLGKLWEKDQYHSYTLDGDDFIAWLEVQQERIDETVEQVADLVKRIEGGESIIMLPNACPEGRVFGECPARYHCYPKLLEEEKKMAEDFVVTDHANDIIALEKYKEGKELEAKGKKLIAKGKAQFERVLGESHPRKLIVEGVGTVSRVTTTRKKWDHKRVEKLLRDKVTECYEEVPSTSLRIALQKEE